MEVGLGGRFDAVNSIKNPLLSIITDVDYDHCEILGKNIEQIAFEKAGIIKKNSIVITGAKKTKVLNVIRSAAKLRNSKLFEINKDFKGIELAVLEPNKNKGSPLSIFREGLANVLLGNKQGLTVIGPANIIKEIKKDPNKIELLTKEIRAPKKKKKKK